MTSKINSNNEMCFNSISPVNNSQPLSLTRLPLELISRISKYLDYKDLKGLVQVLEGSRGEKDASTIVERLRNRFFDHINNTVYSYFQSQASKLAYLWINLTAAEIFKDRKVATTLSKHPILQTGFQSLSAQKRGEVILQHACDDLLTTVKALLSSGPISDESRGAAVYRAASGSHVGVVEALLRSGPIPNQDLLSSLYFAATMGDLAVVQAFLANSPISDQSRERAIGSAARNGHLAVVEALLESGPIPNSLRITLIEDALKNYQFRIASVLIADAIK